MYEPATVEITGVAEIASMSENMTWDDKVFKPSTLYPYGFQLIVYV